MRWRRATDKEEDSMAVEVPDSWGLTGKVAVVTGGGAVGDGIGNGRAAAISSHGRARRWWWSTATRRACATHRPR